jgi:hypothetical protein
MAAEKRGLKQRKTAHNGATERFVAQLGAKRRINDDSIVKEGVWPARVAGRVSSGIHTERRAPHAGRLNGGALTAPLQVTGAVPLAARRARNVADGSALFLENP